MFTNPRSRTFLLRSSALCGVALLGVACGGAGEDDTADASSETGIESDPLLAGLLDGKTFEEAEFEVQQQAQECMTALGWEYTAVAPGSDGGGGLIEVGGGDMDEFAATSGYGISTMTGDGSLAVVGGGSVGSTGAGGGSDPNAQYVESLSPEDQEAYYRDLFGAPPADAADGAVDPMAVGGCYGEASDAVYGENAFDQLNDQFEDVAARAEADPRIAEAYAEWSACMAEAGYTYSKPMETFDDFFARLQALGQEPDPAALKTLQDDEIATAKADRECAKQTELDRIQQEVFEEISEQVASGS